MKYIEMVIVFLCISVFTACSDASKETVTQDGFYLGFRKLTVDSKATHEHFPMMVVYPTNTPSEQVRFGPFKMELAIGAEVAEGTFPLAIISHGSGGSDLGHRSIAFALVKKGFIVAMPLHPKNNFKDNKAEGTVNNWKNRPLHISASIDAVFVNKVVASLNQPALAQFWLSA